MSRALRNAVLAVLFLASAALAGAPDAPFDAAAKDAFRPGQREAVLALDGGVRYSIRDGRLHDAFLPGAPALTNAQAAELFVLRLGSASRRPDPAAAAAELVAQRLARMPAVAIPRGGAPAVDFDGGGARRYSLTGPAPDAARALALHDPGVLQARFLSRLVIRGQPAEREAVADAVEGMLKTKLGQELAREFVLEGAKAEVILAPLEGAATSYKDGITTVSGTQGSTSVDKDPTVVKLSRAYLHAEPGWRRVSMAGTLGHELFGHAFEQQRAKKAGLHHAAEYHYRGDELGSRLIDWTIQTQLNGTNVDGDPGAYLEDPEGYARNLWALSGYYAVTLSAQEMRNPVDTLKARRPILTEALAKTREGIKDMEEWAPIIAHFKTVHKMDPRRLVDAERDVREYLDWARRHIDDIGDVRKSLESRISFWGTPAGARERDEIVRAAGSSYIRQFEARLKKRALDLTRLRTAGRGPASGPAMVLPGLVITASKTGELLPEPVSLRELGAMYRQDKKDNPTHWENKK